MQKPSFDTWTVIFLFAIVQGLFFSFILITRKEKHVSRYLLAGITLVFSLILSDYVLYWTGYQFFYPYLIYWPVILIFTFGPLFYLYLKSLFLKNSIRAKDILHFLPAIVCLFYYSPVILKSVKDKQDFILGKIRPESIDLTPLFIWLGIASMIIYSIVIFLNFKQFAQSYPNLRNWFNMLWIFFTGFTISYLSYFILCRFSFFNPSWDYAISFFMTFFIYTLAGTGYSQPKIFNGFGLFEEEKIKYKTSPVSGDVGKEIVEKLALKMIEKKYFLYPDLKLDKLAELMQINKHYLSQAINEHLKMNFFEYINSLRIEEAKSLLVSNKNYTVIEVAYQVGYNNKVSFNKAFRNFTGLTPTEFKNQNKTVKHYQN